MLPLIPFMWMLEWVMFFPSFFWQLRDQHNADGAFRVQYCCARKVMSFMIKVELMSSDSCMEVLSRG